MRVAIAGYGIEGEVNYQYWSQKTSDVTIFDEAEQPSHELPKDAAVRLGPGVLSDMQGYDLVIRTAGLNPASIKTDGKIWSATNEFFAHCPAPIIGVTGTKGKGTTCSLIARILEEAGKTVHLVGNIGTPALEVLPSITPDDIVVFELSSFQLWDIEQSPETAVLLMIEEDHLNVHKDMDDYVEAKANIGRFQSDKDLLIYHPTNERSARAAAASPANKKRYMSNDGADVVDGIISIEGNNICATKEVGLLGTHNLENICAAVTAAWRYTQNVDAFSKAVQSFKGLEHRLEFVRELHGVRYINDSFSTNPSSTIAALRAFDEKLILILGGSDKRVDMQDLISALDEQEHTVILMGAAADVLERRLQRVGFNNYENFGDMDSMTDIVKKIQDTISDQTVVLLSPAHASFDMFENVYDRGHKFKEAVGQLS